MKDDNLIMRLQIPNIHVLAGEELRYAHRVVFDKDGNILGGIAAVWKADIKEELVAEASPPELGAPKLLIEPIEKREVSHEPD